MKRTLSTLLVLSMILSPVAWTEEPLSNSAKVSLDFHDVEIKDIVISISQMTGKNFIIDDKVRGKISIISATPVGMQEAYQVFLTALETKGFTIEEVGSVSKIIPVDVANRSGIPSIGSEGQLPGISGQLVTKIVALQHIDANQIQQALRNMGSRSGAIVGYGPTNSLIITDTVSNIQRLEGIISKLDKQVFENSVEVIQVKHAQADDIAQKLIKIFDEERKASGKSTGRRDNIEGGSDITSIMPDSRSNALIVMATRKGIVKVLDLLQELDRPLTGKSKSGIHIVKLKHAKAEELAATLATLLGGGSGGSSAKKTSSRSSSSSSSSRSSSSSSAGDGDSFGGSSPAPVTASSSGDSVLAGIFQGDVRVVSDSNTNSLIVTAAPNDFEALTPIIDQLDSRRAQVLVESLIMEVSLDKGTAVGLSLHGAAGKDGLGGGLASTGFNPIAPLGVQDAFTKLAASAAGGLLAGAATKAGFTIPGTNMKVPISGATFKALQQNKYINVLSSPNILTTDNKKAEIAIGKKISVPQVSINMAGGTSVPTTQFTREPVELKLTVTPQINEGNEVTMEVEQYIQEVEAPRDNAPPDTSERRTLTTIVANDGQTVVIGGLIKDKDVKTTTKVPLLGDIPLVGYLFRDTKKATEKTNLLLFLTPHIIRDPADMTRVSVMRNNQRKAFNKANGIPENKALRDYELDKGLNMAAPVSAEKPKAPKRYDYENYSIETSAEEDGSQDQLARKREERKVNDTVESVRAREQAPSRKAPAGSPFADIRPPSSGTN